MGELGIILIRRANIRTSHTFIFHNGTRKQGAYDVDFNSFGCFASAYDVGLGRFCHN